MTTTSAATAVPQPSLPRHLPYLDGLRALAALFVVLHHSYIQVPITSADLPRGTLSIFRVLLLGHDAVDVFIVLSGFCLMLPVINKNGDLVGGAVNFFRKRALRILPPYYLALGLSLLLIKFAVGHKTGTHWDCSLPVDKRSVIAHLILIQDLSGRTNTIINHAMWSISVEWRIYFLFPLMVWLRRRWGSIWVTIGTLGISYSVVVLSEVLSSPSLKAHVMTINPQYLGLFALGAFAADLAFAPRFNNALLRNPNMVRTILAVTTLAAIIATKVTHIQIYSPATPIVDLFVGIWAAALLFAASGTSIPLLNRFLSWKPLVTLGTFAYSIYLIHAPLIQVVWQYILPPLHGRPILSFLGLVFIGLPLILAASYLFFLIGERPFLNTSKRKRIAPEPNKDQSGS